MQHSVVLVVALLRRVHAQVVGGLRLLVLLLILHLNAESRTQRGRQNTVSMSKRQVCDVQSVTYVALELAGLQNVLQLQEVGQVCGPLRFLVLVGFIFHLQETL